MSAKHTQQGASLIEVLIAVLVLSIGLIGALKLQSEGVRQNANSRYVLIAATYAQTAMDGKVFAHTVSGWSQTQWAADLAKDLPQGLGEITCSGSPSICTVVIKWTPPGRDQESASYVVRTGA